VSIATVSRVLNNPSTVKEDKRQLVVRAIADLDFRPNHSARTLKSKSFGSIALIVSNLANAFFAQMVSEIDESLAENGYDILLCNTNMRKDRLEQYLRRLPQRGVDAVIISGSSYLDDPEIVTLISEVINRGIPVICSGTRVRGLSLPTVITDSTRALHDLAGHLAHTGRSRVAYLGGREHSIMAKERLTDFREGLDTFGIEIDGNLTVEVPYNFAAGRDAIEELFSIDAGIDAVVCGGDQIALGAIVGLREMGRSVPGDVAVTGFDDIEVARFTFPALTSIAVNISGIAESLTKSALSAISGATNPTETRIPSELFIRESSLSGKSHLHSR
jgi:DNA-binding LacI/PurR family transcriptional regulator